jgi:hypothetical protein
MALSQSAFRIYKCYIIKRYITFLLRMTQVLHIPKIIIGVSRIKCNLTTVLSKKLFAP